MKSIIITAVCTLTVAPAIGQEVTIAAKAGKLPTAAEAAHCVAYYRAEAKLQRQPNAPFEETLRGQAWKSYLQNAAKAVDSATLIAGAEKDVATAIAKSKTEWRKPYEEPCGAYEQVRLP